MDTLKEYLKIKKMSDRQEIAEYIGESLDTSSFKNFLTSCLNYLTILMTIGSEEDLSIRDFKSIRIKIQNLKKEEKNVVIHQMPLNTNSKSNGLHEARVINLFTKKPQFGANIFDN